MIDTEATLRSYLISDPGISTGGIQVVASVDPPSGYDPSSNGSMIVFNRRSGSPDETRHILYESHQFRCFGNSESDARTTYHLLYDALKSVKQGDILNSDCEVLGQLIREPETDWPVVITFFTITFRTT